MLPQVYGLLSLDFSTPVQETDSYVNPTDEYGMWLQLTGEPFIGAISAIANYLIATVNKKSVTNAIQYLNELKRTQSSSSGFNTTLAISGSKVDGIVRHLSQQANVSL